MVFRLITSQNVLSDVLAKVLAKDKYVEFLRNDASRDIAYELFEKYALYEHYDDQNIFGEVHKWTLMVEDDPEVIIKEIVKQEREARFKR